ncbi:MAG: ring-cleaving dioxygenase [Litorilinea sp.]
MTNPLGGIHHITAMCGDAQRNVNLYVRGLGQRLVKKTVNFDDPTTWHLYYGDTTGSPGTIMTFFPWPHAASGIRGRGEVASFTYCAPAAAQDFWAARLVDYGARLAESETRFGETVMPFQDEDGLWCELVLVDELVDTAHAISVPSASVPSASVPSAAALGAFHSATLWVEDAQPTWEFLEGVFGWTRLGAEGPRTRMAVPGARAGGLIDVVHAPGAGRGRLGPGSIHHIAFRVADAEAQQGWRKRLLQAGVAVTPVRDRQYFQSIYFRVPGGVLFEIATDVPGFLTDETAAHQGENLALPPWLESQRADIAAKLPPLD